VRGPTGWPRGSSRGWRRARPSGFGPAASARPYVSRRETWSPPNVNDLVRAGAASASARFAGRQRANARRGPGRAADQIRSAARVANPAAYPAATLSALAPLARRTDRPGGIIVDAKSGVSGAGRGGAARGSASPRSTRTSPPTAVSSTPTSRDHAGALAAPRRARVDHVHAAPDPDDAASSRRATPRPAAPRQP